MAKSRKPEPEAPKSRDEKLKAACLQLIVKAGKNGVDAMALGMQYRRFLRYLEKENKIAYRYSEGRWYPLGVAKK